MEENKKFFFVISIAHNKHMRASSSSSSSLLLSRRVVDIKKSSRFITTTRRRRGMIYDVRKATIERDRRRASSSSSSSSGAATDDDDVRENDIDVNVDAALANLARERRGQTLFQRFMEEDNNNNENLIRGPNESDDDDGDDDDGSKKKNGYDDLFHGACLIAMHRNPDLDVDEMKRRVRELADFVEKELPPNREERFPLRTIKKISTLLFNKEVHPETAFRGNLDDYYAIENSCVDAVLETKRGIPITLSLVYMEVAKMVGIDMIGVNLPGHFMIRPCDVPDCEILIDCFHDGDVLFVEDAEEMLSKLYKLDTEKGEKVTIDRSFLEDKDLKPKTFYTRMLTNLKSIYFNKSDYRNALAMCEYQKCCAPDPSIKAFNARDAGMCHFLLQNYSDAMLDLTEYLDSEYSNNSSAEDRARILDLREQARLRLAL